MASSLIARVSVEGAAAAQGQLLGMGSAADATEARFRSLAVIGSGLLVAGLVAVGVKSAEMAADFQQAVNRLRTGAGDTQDSFASLSSGILKVSTDTGILTPKLTAAMYEILSSNQRGAQAYATLAAAAKGAVIEQAEVTDVANTLSGVMTNYGTKVFGASNYMNGLITAVSRGKITLQDLSVAMGPIDPVAHALGISFSDLAAAMSTQTNAMIPAARAATGLRFMMQALEVPTNKTKDAMAAMGLDSVKVAEEMKVSLPGALQMIYDAARRAGPEGSVPFDRAISDMVGGQRSLSTFLALTGDHMKQFKDNAKAVADSMKAGSGNVEGWTLAQTNFNVIMDKARASVAAAAIGLGMLLLPALGKIVAVVPQIVSYFTDFSAHANVLIPILAGLGAVIATVLVPAIWAFAAGMIAATWPVLAIGAAVAGLVAIFMHFYSTNAGFKAFIDNLVTGFRTLWSLLQANFMPTMQRLGAFFQSTILPALQQVGSFLVSTFKPAWEQLVQTWKNTLLPALQMLWGLFQTILPVLKVVGLVILGIVVAALVILVAAVALVVKAIALLIQGFAWLVSFTGAAFSAIGTTITNFKNLVGNIFNAIGTFIHDKLIWIYDHNKYVKAFVDLLVKFFNDTKNQIGSIFSAIGTFIHDRLTWIHDRITDFKNAVGGTFDGLGTAIHQKITDAWNWIVGFVSGWPSKAVQWGINLIQGFINGIGSMFSAVGDAVSNIMGNVASILGFHSPAEKGPGKDADTWAPNLMKMYTQGLAAALPDMQAALNTLMVPVGNTLSGHGPAMAAPSRAGAAGPTIIVQPPAIYLDGQRLTQAQMPYITNAIRNATGARGF